MENYVIYSDICPLEYCKSLHVYLKVLLKCTDQTTAVDMWACGVILLCLLSGRSNFFNAPDDLTSLLQLVVLFGKERMCTAARKMGKNLIVDIDVERKGSEPRASLKVL